MTTPSEEKALRAIGRAEALAEGNPTATALIALARANLALAQATRERTEHERTHGD